MLLAAPARPLTRRRSEASGSPVSLRLPCAAPAEPRGAERTTQSSEASDLPGNMFIVLIFIRRPRLHKARNYCDFYDLKLISIHFLDTKQNILNCLFHYIYDAI